MKTIKELFYSDDLTKAEFQKQQEILKDLNPTILPFVDGKTLREKEKSIINMPFDKKLELYSKIKKIY